MSCISREVGHDLVESGFAAVEGRSKWAVPWMENDPNMTAPQLWAGRMRYDAADALNLGCTGLLAIHWRTKVLAPTVAALAAASWDQSYRPANWDLRSSLTATERHGGRTLHSTHPVVGATESSVYETLLEDCKDCYLTGIPDGRYTITLLFNEPVHANAGQRVFDIELQGQVIERQLDIFARVGQNHALDLVYSDVKIGDSPLHLHFIPHVGTPIIAGIGVEGTSITGATVTRWIHLGGGSAGKFAGDSTRDKPVAAVRARSMPVKDFYVDFCRANFGHTVAEPAGRLLAQIDGANLPQSSHWERGPGAINSLAAAPGSFAFLGDFARLRSAIRGNGNLARFDYWLNTFRYQEALAHAGGIRSDLDDQMHLVQTEFDPQRKKAFAEIALKARVQLARAWEQMMSRLVSCADSSGELGTIANLEQHNRTRLHFLDLYDKELATVLIRPLPTEIYPGHTYDGPPRLIVPTVRSEAKNSEALKVTILAIDRSPMTHVALHWRRWKQSTFQTIAADHLGRAVYEVSLPAEGDDLEYYVSAKTSEGNEVVWPATGPQICQTVIRIP